MQQSSSSHKRWHLLLEEWVIIAPSTNQRPWNGAIANVKHEEQPLHDENCYLCPNVKRASGKINPNYTEPYSFFNDFASFSINQNDDFENEDFEISTSAQGICKVICYSPKHNTTLAQLPTNQLVKIIDLWKEEYLEISKIENIQHILIFENKGKVIGVSNPHPHGQLYATDFVPKNIAQMATSFSDYRVEKGKSLFEDLIKHELETGTRIVYENENWVIFVPYFARFAYETYLVPKRHFQNISQLNKLEKETLSDALHIILNKYDALFGFPLPNIMLLMNAPMAHSQFYNPQDFHFHIQFLPPLREADKLKYLAGFESGGGNIINPIAPEIAADILKKL